MGNLGQLALLSVRGDQEFASEEDLKVFQFSSPSHLTFSINRTGAQEVSGATWEPCSVHGTHSFIYLGGSYVEVVVSKVPFPVGEGLP